MAELSRRLANLSPAKRRLLEQQLAGKPIPGEPIALVGMACRFAGAASLDQYWRLIVEQLDATGEIPPDRWDIEAFYDPDLDAPGKMAVRWGGFVDGVDQFDPLFFGISPREASRMDPQQRLLLEVGWEALEHAGLPASRLAGSAAGVFVGIGGTDYSKIPTHYENHLEYIDAHVGTGNALSIAANRLSYVLDLRGPSFIVDTACSSALLAVHLAIGSLRARECDVALAAGVNLILSPEVMIAFSKARMLSTTGKCRPFDAAADGYVRGEGCGVIVLKRLTDAVRDGDNIWAILRGSAVNQDGRTSGITAPNSLSQHRVIRAALAASGITASQIGYLEAHGTGTPLGDPLEVQGLERLFRRSKSDEPPCYMTSVKANIGHTETASGMASIIKVALMMRHGLIPGQLHFQELNPHIQLEQTRLVVPRESLPWEPIGGERYAGVSSFGFGGTNVHVIMQASQPRQVPAPSEDRPLHLLTVSAKTTTALDALAGRYAEYLEKHPRASPADVCHSANAGRSHHQHRLSVVAADGKQLRERLEAFRRGERCRGVKSGQVRLLRRPKVAFVFTGQGSQYIGMGRQLYDTEPAFREILDRCQEILRPVLQKPLLSVLYPAAGEQSPLDETAYTQPALFALEYALASLWQSWGVRPDYVLGHSLGEYVAACVAGVFSLEDGLRLVARRAQLMQQLPRDGAMAAVFAPEQQVAEAIAPVADQVAIAAANGPENTVISGKAEVVDQLLEQFAAKRIAARRLTVSHAFHSPLMDPIVDRCEELVASVRVNRPQIPIVSNVTGRLLEEAPDARYWRNHLRNTVRFADDVATLAQEEVSALLEIGPSPTLLGMARRCQRDWKVAFLASLRTGQPDWQVLLNSLSELYLLGVEVDWRGFDRSWPRRRLQLPGYPFERSRHWIDLTQTGARRTGTSATGPLLHPLLGRRLSVALPTRMFQSELSSRRPDYLQDHQVQGSPVLPAAAYVEMALAAAAQVFGPGKHVVEDVSIQHAMFLPEGATRVVQVSVSPETAGRCDFEIHSTPADGDDQPHWTLHACGKLRSAATEPETAGADREPIDVERFAQRAVDTKDRDEFYQMMQARQLAYGPAFQGLEQLQRSEREAIGHFRLPEQVLRQSGEHIIHPALLDLGLQITAGVVPLEHDGSYSPYTYMPTGIRRVRVLGDPAQAQYVYAVRTSSDDQPSPEVVQADVLLLDATGRTLVEIEGACVQRIGRAATEAPEEHLPEWLYQVDWAEQPGVEPHPESLAGNTWVLFADRRGVADRLAEKLAAHGAHCVLVAAGGEDSPAGESTGSTERRAGTGAEDEPSSGADAAARSQPPAPAERIVRVTIDPAEPSEYERLAGELFSRESVPAGIVHLWSLDVADRPSHPGEAIAQWERFGCLGVLHLVQQLVHSTAAKVPQLWLVTQGAQAVGDEQPVQPFQAPLWGLGRVLAMEHPEFRSRLVDVGPEESADDIADQLLAELTGGAADDQIALRHGQRYAARLEPAAELWDRQADFRRLTFPKGSFRMRLGKPGSFDSLYFEPWPPQRPEAGQVQVEVRATGLNFSDVLKAMGLYPGITDPVVPLGIECSGVVTAVGDRVDRFAPGDAVMGVVPFSFATHAVTAEYALVHKPKNLSDEEAATVPITFLTAYHALCRLAHLAPGERVLIHAGAGGVGLAAIQIAQHIGAEVFATAGSEQKRQFLRNLGVEHVFSSRTLEFAEQIMEVTDRQGIDVVLNSLPGDVITKSLSILRAYGRFLEIGKTDIYQNRMIGLLPFQDNLSYFAIDLDRMLRQRPDYIRQLFAEVIEHIEAGHYRPLPLTRFPLAEVRSAFRYMAQRKNIGKVVVSVVDRPAEAAAEEPVGRLREDGTYLITGGLGALGLEVAQHLAAHGAGHLVLLSRRPPGERAAAVIAELQRGGTRVVALQGDVTELDSLRAALEQIPDDFPPLRGVIHAAGVLDDGLLADMSPEQFRRPLAPKVLGAWNLHRLTGEMPLDFFVMFSSIACVLGSPAQANYAAGNAFLDALAAYRRSRGLPAVAINWGPWSGAGMAIEAGHSEQIEARGMHLIEPELALKVLDHLLDCSPTNVAVIDADWQRVASSMGNRRPPLLAQVFAHLDEAATSTAQSVDRRFLERLDSAPPEQRVPLLRSYFAEELARIMGVDAEELDPDQPLGAVGLDSLMAMELKNNLESRLAFTLPIARFMESPSLNSLAEVAAELIGGDGRPIGQRTATAGTEAEWSPLVPLRTGGSRPPLFCLHALGGDIRCYRDLAEHMDPNWPLYALRARGAEGLLEPHASIDQMAADYLAAIRSLQPHGPYFLAGWSAGGIYALELARRLLADGETLGLLAFFDTPLPSIYDNVDLDDEARFLCDLIGFTNRFAGTQMELSYEQLHGLPAQQMFEVALEEAKRKAVLPPEASPEFIRRLCEVGRANVRWIMQYHLRPIDHEIVMFLPSEHGVLAEMSGQQLEADLGWSTVAGQRFTVVRSPGDHFTMMTGTNAGRLAELLTARLEEALVRSNRHSTEQATRSPSEH